MAGQITPLEVDPTSWSCVYLFPTLESGVGEPGRDLWPPLSSNEFRGTGITKNASPVYLHNGLGFVSHSRRFHSIGIALSGFVDFGYEMQSYQSD